MLYLWVFLGSEFMIGWILLIILGFVLLILGANFLVDGASKIAKIFHIPEIIIGLTIVSIGTSMPELFVSVTSAMENYSDMAIGNVVGSNICNLFLILGLSSIIRSIKFKKETSFIDIPMCLFFSAIFWIFCNTGGGVSRIEGLGLIFLFLIFIGYTVFMSIRGMNMVASENKKNTMQVSKFYFFQNVLLVIIGIVALKYGGDFVVDNAVLIAKKFNISEAIISLTILAVGTSLPELVTSVAAAFKGNSDIAIGNIIGSNIFNVLLIIGVAAVISPISYNSLYNLNIGILLFGTVLLALFPFIKPKDEMSRFNGIIFVILYGTYMGLLFFR